MRVVNIDSVPDDKKGMVVEELNRANAKYKLIKFFMDAEGKVNAQYDFLLTAENIGDSAIEIVLRSTMIIDDLYPKLMKIIWA